MYHTVYKITNVTNGKFYIGMHKTTDINDGYMGSGRLIRRAINKHGADNFIKEILHVFDNEQDMKDKEKELVILCEQSYNLCPGGQGGFGYVNKHGMNWSREKNVRISGFKNLTKKQRTEYGKRGNVASSNTRRSFTAEQRREKLSSRSFLGRHHTEETKQKMRTSKNVGISNSQHGTRWATNGVLNIKVTGDHVLPQGYYFGRTLMSKRG